MEALYLYRCVDCGVVQVLTSRGGPLAECCDKGDLREFVWQRVDPGKWEPPMWPNLRRATVGGPPAMLWLQGQDAYGLFVDGKQVFEFEGGAMDARSRVEFTNDVLRELHEHRERSL